MNDLNETFCEIIKLHTRMSTTESNYSTSHLTLNRIQLSSFVWTILTKKVQDILFSSKLQEIYLYINCSLITLERISSFNFCVCRL